MGIIKMAKKKGRKRLSVINLGTVVFLVIIIYLTAYVIRYLGKEKLAIYEVSESNMSENISGTGMILREETLITTEEKGYVNYYVKDGSRVRKDGIVYTLIPQGSCSRISMSSWKRKTQSAMRKNSRYIKICRFFPTVFPMIIFRKFTKQKVKLIMI